MKPKEKETDKKTDEKFNRHAKYDKSKRERKFRDEWKQEFPWVRFQDGKMFCYICQKYPAKHDKFSPLVVGAGNSKQGFRKDTLKAHQRSKAHIFCEDIHNAHTDPTKTPMAIVRRKMSAESCEKMEKIFRSAYYIAKENLAFAKFEGLCQLQISNGLNMGQNYMNIHGCKEIIVSIGETLKADLDSRLAETNFVSVMADGSTDSAIQEQESVYVRYTHQGKIYTELVQTVDVEHSNAPGVLEGITKALESSGLTMDICKKKLVCINLDGASVNMGKVKGVQALLKKEIPNLLVIHCINHNLELAILDVKKSEPALSNFERALKNVFNFYYWSPKRRRELSKIALALEEDLARFGGIKQIRWLASQARALEQSLQKNFIVTLTHLEYAAAHGNGEESAKAKGILKDVKTVKFLKLLHFMLDFSILLKDVSLLFQKEDFVIVEFLPALEAIMMKLQNLKYHEGENLRRLYKDCAEDLYKDLNLNGTFTEGMEPLYQSIIDGAIEFLDERFSMMQEEPYNLFTVFDYRYWPKKRGELAVFGHNELQTLVRYFNQSTELLPEDEILDEWVNLKSRLIHKHKDENYQAVYGSLLSENPQELKHILLVVELMMSVSCSTAAVERGFSCMNLQKTNVRTCLSQESLISLLRIGVNGPPVGAFSPQNAIQQWLTRCKGTRHVEGHAHPVPRSVLPTDHDHDAVEPQIFIDIE